MKCTIKDYPGEYERKYIIHTIKYRDSIKVIDNVPADVCSICGDSLISYETTKPIENILNSNKAAKSRIPLY